MRRINPLVSLAGVAFAIDVFSEEFVDVSEPANRFSFAKLLRRDRGYIVLFDPEKSTVWSGNALERPDHILIVPISPIVKIDPVGLFRRLKKPLKFLQMLESDSEWLQENVQSSLKYIDQWTGR